MSEAFDQWREGPDGDMNTPSLDDLLCEQMARAFEAGRASAIVLDATDLGYVLMCVRMKLRKDERSLEHGKGGEKVQARVDLGRRILSNLRAVRKRLGKESS